MCVSEEHACGEFACGCWWVHKYGWVYMSVSVWVCAWVGVCIGVGASEFVDTCVWGGGVQLCVFVSVVVLVHII